MLHNLYIVDDDEAVRASLCRLVSRQPDYVVRSFPSGEAFLKQFDELEPGVVLLDFHMKGANGITVLNAIRAISQRFVVMMLTAHGAVHRSVDAMKAGAFDFIEKPYDSAALMMCLDLAFAELDKLSTEVGGRDAAVARLALLTPRETEVIAGLAAGYSNKQIAWTLQISPRTVEVYRANLMVKLNVGSLAEALQLVFVAEQAIAA
ncbi:response regulator [Sphingomonas sp. AOB5]|uniref:response regulator transcription factor n=1 Tax=Sphingomonas sp. AOB5 TaxID=3034017 RepID=UPI0023F8F7A6|nr:response regulator [Sphingomonas sp. AOB5]MDF7775814.1 response regulator [Sphingomonas sp. AOB5]